jgi:hypothetical protein
VQCYTDGVSDSTAGVEMLGACLPRLPCGTARAPGAHLTVCCSMRLHVCHTVHRAPCLAAGTVQSQQLGSALQHGLTQCRGTAQQGWVAELHEAWPGCSNSGLGWYTSGGSDSTAGVDVVGACHHGLFCASGAHLALCHIMRLHSAPHCPPPACRHCTLPAALQHAHHGQTQRQGWRCSKQFDEG